MSLRKIEEKVNFSFSVIRFQSRHSEIALVVPHGVVHTASKLFAIWNLFTHYEVLISKAINIVTCRMKAGISDPEITHIARQRHGKHFFRGNQ
jgi:hypothetical protein